MKSLVYTCDRIFSIFRLFSYVLGLAKQCSSYETDLGIRFWIGLFSLVWALCSNGFQQIQQLLHWSFFLTWLEAEIPGSKPYNVDLILVTEAEGTYYLSRLRSSFGDVSQVLFNGTGKISWYFTDISFWLELKIHWLLFSLDFH